MQRNAAWAAAIALGAAALGLQLAPAALAPAVSCPGLLERTAIVAAQIARDAPLGLWLLRADRVIFFLTVVFFSCAAFLAAGSWLAMAAAALAFAASPIFAPALSPFDPFVAAAASLAVLFGLREMDPSHPVSRWPRHLCLLVVAVAVPRTALLIAATFAFEMAAIALALVLAVTWLVLRSMPILPPVFAAAEHAANCFVPTISALHTQFGASVSALTASVGVYALMLAALGLFAVRARLTDRRAWPLIACAMAAVAAALTRDMSTARALTPALVVIWILASAGLAEVIRAAGAGPGGRIGALVLAVLLPLVPIAGRYHIGHASPMSATAFGHDRMTLDGMRRALQLLPAKTVLVSEDATTEILLRAASPTWQRSGKTLRIVDAEPSAVSVAAADSTWQVFAFPAAQTDLPKLGFELSDVALPGVSGLSVVKSGGACVRIDETWKPIDFAPRAPMLVVRSEHPREDGAVAIWFGSARPIDLTPVGWPEWVVPGFLPVAYSPEDKARLEQDAVQDGLTGHEPVLEPPYVVRLELWKVPDAPRVLPIALGAERPALGLIHVTPGVTLQLCPGYSHTAQTITFPK